MKRWCAALLCVVLGLARARGRGSEPELKLWHVYRGGEEEALEQAAEPSPADGHPGRAARRALRRASRSKLTSAIPHGVGPDVFIFDHERLRSFHQQKIVAPSDARARPHRVPQPAVEALELDGKTYGYPLALKCLALYVNTELRARAAGDHRRAGVAARAALADPRQNRFGLAYESGDFYFHAPFLFGFGGELFDAERQRLVRHAGHGGLAGLREVACRTRELHPAGGVAARW